MVAPLSPAVTGTRSTRNTSMPTGIFSRFCSPFILPAPDEDPPSFKSSPPRHAAHACSSEPHMVNVERNQPLPQRASALSPRETQRKPVLWKNHLSLYCQHLFYHPSTRPRPCVHWQELCRSTGSPAPSRGCSRAAGAPHRDTAEGLLPTPRAPRARPNPQEPRCSARAATSPPASRAGLHNLKCSDPQQPSSAPCPRL